MKDSGVSYEELSAKVDDLLKLVTDEDKKKTIDEYGPSCRRIYGDRLKQGNHEHTLEEYFQTHLSWLTNTQKDELKQMKK
ncbi:ABA1 protein, partial [Dicrurus megarhynchus]|nr:ABA1 protein [Dicrurus megarhynchus]